MPRGDGTGPMGLGPMTGRAAGRCAGFNTPGFANTGFGFGGGFGRGRGFGRARGFGRGYGFRSFGFAPLQAAAQPQANEQEFLQQELNSIEQEEKALQQEKEELKKKIDGLKKHE
ncbi:MAG: DUF5320 domain-containing protein [Nanoarchaeota archaeon]|nr:DUF5320 domain-containing protein [Nanoarchaeota archaeon]MBU1005734.1 DUF5320 domain-containing protein [Nanoarchaeota archaeon]MBU1945581.1 DUF5320 domain-containing protein [Nanoarchaeota archaeon]